MAYGGRDLLGLVRGGEGAIAGTVVCAAAIAAGARYWDSAWRLSVAIIATVFIYWVAHVHAVTIGSALTQGHHPLVALRVAAVETAPIAAASVLPVGVLVIATLLGADLRVASWSALGATIVLLVVYSYLAGVRAGLGPRGRVISAAGGAIVGLLVVLLKSLQH